MSVCTSTSPSFTWVCSNCKMATQPSRKPIAIVRPSTLNDFMGLAKDLRIKWPRNLVRNRFAFQFQTVMVPLKGERIRYWPQGILNWPLLRVHAELSDETWSERWKVGRPGRLWISHTCQILWRKPLLQCLLPPHDPMKRDGKTLVLSRLHRQICTLIRPRFCRAPRRLDCLSDVAGQILVIVSAMTLYNFVQ